MKKNSSLVAMVVVVILATAIASHPAMAQRFFGPDGAYFNRYGGYLELYDRQWSKTFGSTSKKSTCFWEVSTFSGSGPGYQMKHWDFNIFVSPNVAVNLDGYSCNVRTWVFR